MIWNVLYYICIQIKCIGLSSVPAAGRSVNLMSLFLAGKDLEIPGAVWPGRTKCTVYCISKLNNSLSKALLCERRVNDEGRICVYERRAFMENDRDSSIKICDCVIGIQKALSVFSLIYSVWKKRKENLIVNRNTDWQWIWQVDLTMSDSGSDNALLGVKRKQGISLAGSTTPLNEKHGKMKKLNVYNV